jgi:hypothetical protein
LRHYCSLFNSVYQFHAQLLYESICANDKVGNSHFYFFCFDQESAGYFKQLNLANITVVPVEKLEQHLPALKAVKPERSLAEYFFTSTPAICKYVFENYSSVNEVVYLDADLFFFQSPEILFDEIGNSSVSIIPHRFNLLNYYKNIFGFYNVGWLSFKRDSDGLACLEKWHHDTLEWCYDKLTFRRYADQKYLDYWKSGFKSVHVIKNTGANVAPWNVGNYKIQLKSKHVYVDDVPLVFYHFASLKFVDGSYYTTVSSYLSFVSKEIVELIYQPYISRLHQLGFVPRISIRLNQNPVVKMLRRYIRRFYKDTIVIENIQ